MTHGSRHLRARGSGGGVRLFLALGLAVLCLLGGGAPASVEAAGFYAPAIGSRAMGRGGAFTATGADLTSHWHNPANLSRLRGLHLQIDATLLFNAFRFERDPLPGRKPFPTVHNTAAPNFIPFLGISYDLLTHTNVPDRHNLVLSFGVWGPNGGNYDYSGSKEDGSSAQPQCQGSNKDNFLCHTEGPQRYSVIRSRPFQMFLSWALAYGVKFGGFGLRVGGGFQLVQTRVEQSLALKALTQGTDTDEFDAIISIDTTSALTPSGNFGLTLDLPGGVSVGAAFKLPLNVTAQGTLKVDKLPTSLANSVSITGDAAQLDLRLPWILRVGAAWVPPFFRRLEIEVAFVYEAWSVLDKIVLSSPEGDNQFRYSVFGAAPAPLEPIDIIRQWQDAWSIRAGVQFAIIPRHFFVRAGYFYETSAIPESHFNVSEINGERHAISFGLEGRIPAGPVQFVLNAGYTHTFETPLDVTNSEERAIILVPLAEGDQGDVVGNGKYRAQLDLVSFSLAINWGATPTTAKKQ